MFEKVAVFRLPPSVIICLFAGVIGSVSTASSPERCYVFLEKPPFNPPN
ncbi:MAG: tryptophan-rich sensory protein [Euryarchaeota archaeon]|nr:tryptophan-rich sensory protein [Euryarchaeota archaeon]